MKFSISPPGPALDAALQHKIDNKTKPLGSLGVLEKIALRVGRIQRSLSPRFTHPNLVVFAADHGAAKAGLSAYPQEVTWQMVENCLAGGAGINAFARQHGFAVTVVDAGVAHEFGPREGLIDAKIAAGTRSYLDEPAMTHAQCLAAIERGAQVVRALADDDCNVLVVGEMGIGNTASAALLTHAFTRTPLLDCIGRGTGLDDAGLARKRELLGHAITRASLPLDADAVTVLAEFGGFEIAMMAGAFLGGAERGMTLLIDGFIATSGCWPPPASPRPCEITASSAIAPPNPAISPRFVTSAASRCSIWACASARVPAPQSPIRWSARAWPSSTRGPVSKLQA
jgi:nicotinate-nucleotide--dimethylbenzimidazole phosphoribosyltransferase